MRKTIWTAAVLAVCCAAPAAAQQVEKSPFAAASAPTVSVPATQAETAPAERAPSLYVSPDQMDESVRASEKARGEKAPMGSRGWWTTVAAVAAGVIIAVLLLD